MARTLETKVRQNVIDWNKNQFYRAIGQERWKDAERYKGNIEQLEGKE